MTLYSGAIASTLLQYIPKWDQNKLRYYNFSHNRVNDSKIYTHQDKDPATPYEEAWITIKLKSDSKTELEFIVKGLQNFMVQGLGLHEQPEN